MVLRKPARAEASVSCRKEPPRLSSQLFIISEPREGDLEARALRAGPPLQRRAPSPRPARGLRAPWLSGCHVRGPWGGIPAPHKTERCLSFGIVCLSGKRRGRQNGGVRMRPEAAHPGLAACGRPPARPQAGWPPCRPRGQVQDAARRSRDLAGPGGLPPRRAPSPPGPLRRARTGLSGRGRPSPTPAPIQRPRFLLLIDFLTPPQPPK